jgi:putative PEP-CTERM system TPR-repeat lipoprotein
MDLASQNANEMAPRLQVGLSLIYAGDGERATAWLKDAVALAPENSAANEALVGALLQVGAQDEALNVAKEFAESSPGNVEAVNLVALAHVTQNDLESATREFNRSLAIEPGNKVAVQYLAQIAFRQGNLDAASKYLDQGLAASSEDPALLYAKAVVAVNANNAQAAKNLLEQVIEQGSSSVEPHLLLAKLLIADGQHQAALRVLDDVKVNDRRVLLARADAYFELGQFRNAVDIFENLRRDYPNTPLVHFGLARLYAELKRPNEAEAALDRALVLQPDSMRAKLIKARVLGLRGKFGEARSLIKELGLPESDAQYLEATLFLAVLEGDGEQRLAVSRQLLSVSPTAQHAVALSASYAFLRDEQKATETLVNWLRHHPLDDHVRWELAKLYLFREYDDEAAAEFEKLRVNDPDNVAILNNLAWSLRKSRPALAMQYIEEALSNSAKTSSLLDSYAEIAARLGDAETALRAIDDAVAQSANKPAMRLRRAEIYYLLGERERAIEEAQRVAESQTSDATKAFAIALLKRWER